MKSKYIWVQCFYNLIKKKGEKEYYLNLKIQKGNTYEKSKYGVRVILNV